MILYVRELQISKQLNIYTGSKFKICQWTTEILSYQLYGL